MAAASATLAAAAPTKPASQRPASHKANGTMLERLSHSVTSSIDGVMYKLGHYAARQPRTVAACAVLAMLVLGCGMLIHFKYENQGDLIWPPQSSESVRNKFYVRDELEVHTSNAVVLVEVKHPYTNVLDKSVLTAAIGAAHRAFAVKHGSVSLPDICMKVPGSNDCAVESILYHWNFDPAQVASDPDVVDTVRNKPYPSGQPPRVDDVAGWNDAGTTGQAFQINIVLDKKLAQRNGVSEDDVREWELAFVEEVQSWDYPEFYSYVLAQRSMDDAITKSVMGDMHIVGLGIVMMTIYAYLVLTRRLDAVHSRLGLTAAGSASVLLGMVGSTGLISAFGVLVTNLNQVLIYVVMGIGIDDAFIITNSVDAELYKARQRAKREGRPDPALPNVSRANDDEFAELCARGLSKAASSIAFTSLTDLAAFWLGSFTRIPATSWFCLYAGTAVVFVFAMQVTLFASCLFADIRRQAVRHRDIAVCVPVSPEAVAKLKPVSRLSLVQKFMKRRLAPTITRNRPVQAIIIAAFAVLMGLALYGVTDIQRGFPVVDLTPDEHYTRDYLTVSEKYWPGFQYRRVRLLFMHNQRTATGSTPSEQAVNTQLGMYAARHAAQASRWIDEVPADWWLAGFLQYAASAPSMSDGLQTVAAPWGSGDTVPVWSPSDASAGVSFGAAVEQFRTAVPRFESSVTVSTVGSDTSLRASSCNLLLFPQAREEDVVSAMKESRIDIQAAADPYGVSTSTFVFYFLFSEMDAISAEETVQNMILALTGVAVVCLIFLGSVKVTGLVVALVALIDLNLLGSLHYFNIRLNSISVVNLVLALGLSVDYAAHIAHRFVESASEEVEHGDDDEGDEDDAVTDGHTSQLDAVEGGGKAAQKPALPQTAADRVERAMWVLGASVFNGGWSTFMAIFPLFLTSSTIFLTFFIMMTSIVFLGLAHGLVLLPVLLALCGGIGEKPTGASDAPITAASTGSAGGAPSKSGRVVVNPMDVPSTRMDAEPAASPLNATSAVPGAVPASDPSDDPDQEAAGAAGTAATAGSASSAGSGDGVTRAGPAHEGLGEASVAAPVVNDSADSGTAADTEAGAPVPAEGAAAGADAVAEVAISAAAHPDGAAAAHPDGAAAAHPDGAAAAHRDGAAATHRDGAAATQPDGAAGVDEAGSAWSAAPTTDVDWSGSNPAVGDEATPSWPETAPATVTTPARVEPAAWGGASSGAAGGTSSGAAVAVAELEAVVPNAPTESDA